MKLVVVGIGRAGGRIAESLTAYNARQSSTFVVGSFAFDTTQADLDALTRIPEAHRVLYGQLEVGGQGVDGDRELGKTLAVENRRELLRSLDDVPTSQADAILVAAGLGGGTGSAATRVLAEELRRTHDLPIYGVGALPSADEPATAARNAADSLRALRSALDNLLLFDNEAWTVSGEFLEDACDRANAELARRLGVLFGAGEVDADDTVAASVVDASEIINTLRGGDVSTIGYSSTAVETADTSSGFVSRLLGNSEPEPVEATAAIRVLETGFRKAVRRKLTAPCSLDGTERVLVVVSGPPEWLNRRGIERGRQYVESETGCLELRGGDYPRPDSDRVEIDVLFSGVSDVPQIEALERAALESEHLGNSE
ncbi:tubulin/FtsZ family protein [Haloprofundus salilacus]|uniref:tubulin/FtsZ family protein n=1 Tax=Haloprofundus salilacus TaxID=2876190 RepID=UPI001CC9195D|nr:tubulin/FtsZ family protein [Haloprofundus salilacus]